MPFTSDKSTLQKEEERDFAVPFSVVSTNVRSISLILIFSNLIRSAGSWEKNVLGLINTANLIREQEKGICCTASQVPLSEMIILVDSVSAIVHRIQLIFSSL